jgi:hypothetical protein
MYDRARNQSHDLAADFLKHARRKRTGGFVAHAQTTASLRLSFGRFVRSAM